VRAEAWLPHPWVLLAGAADRGREERSLVARAREGDPSAFDEIVRRHYRRVFKLAYRVLRRREEAEDVTQEAFLRAFSRLRQLSHEGAVGQWLGRIAVNLCLTRLKSRSEEAELAADPAAVARGENSAEDPGRNERIARIREMIGRLPPKYRVAVIAYHMEGRSYREAARLLGIPVLTFRTRLYRGRKMLRDLLR
jgi:RNA polymerase sigma-70 factor (ECF subfamily)